MASFVAYVCVPDTNHLTVYNNWPAYPLIENQTMPVSEGPAVLY
jgi:hypothetical protein